jgi:hypothetical protein
LSPADRRAAEMIAGTKPAMPHPMAGRRPADEEPADEEPADEFTPTEVDQLSDPGSGA